MAVGDIRSRWSYLPKKSFRKTADCIIASFCIDGRHKLLHKDRDFDVFAAHLGLDVVDINKYPEELNLR